MRLFGKRRALEGVEARPMHGPTIEIELADLSLRSSASAAAWREVLFRATDQFTYDMDMKS